MKSFEKLQKNSLTRGLISKTKTYLPYIHTPGLRPSKFINLPLVVKVPAISKKKEKKREKKFPSNSELCLFCLQRF